MSVRTTRRAYLRSLTRVRTFSAASFMKRRSLNSTFFGLRLKNKCITSGPSARGSAHNNDVLRKDMFMFLKIAVSNYQLVK